MSVDLEYGQKIYRWWGRHAGVYRAATAITFLGRESQLRGRAVDRLGLRSRDTVLDLACGPGVNFSLLEGRVGAAGRLIAFDYSEAMLGAAKETALGAGWENVEFVQGDAACMELPEDSLDGALCTLGLSAMPDHEATLCNVHRALRPGGTLVVLDAALFRGPGRALNPLIKPIYRYATNWDHQKELPTALRAVFGSVSVEEHNGGSMFIASAVKAR